MEEDPAKFKKIQINEEESEDSDDEAAAAQLALKAAADKKKKAIADQLALDSAKARASKLERESVMDNLPKTAAAFEKSYNALKKSNSAVVEYLQKLPLTTVEALFKRSEVPIEILSGALKAFKTEDVQGEKWVADFMMSLTKAENFDMTMMFCEDEDKNLVIEVAKKQKDQKLAKEIKSKYQCD